MDMFTCHKLSFAHVTLYLCCPVGDKVSADLDEGLREEQNSQDQEIINTSPSEKGDPPHSPSIQSLKMMEILKTYLSKGQTLMTLSKNILMQRVSELALYYACKAFLCVSILHDIIQRCGYVTRVKCIL